MTGEFRNMRAVSGEEIMVPRITATPYHLCLLSCSGSPRLGIWVTNRQKWFGTSKVFDFGPFSDSYIHSAAQPTDSVDSWTN